MSERPTGLPADWRHLLRRAADALFDADSDGTHDEIVADLRHALACCEDCGRPYGAEHGFPDLVVPRDVWKRIAPRDGNGLLCPSCMCQRAHAAGLSGVRAEFASGPFARPTTPSAGDGGRIAP